MIRPLATLVAVLLLAAACSDGPDDAADGDRAWQPAGTTIETRGLVWAAGSTIHLGDGSTLGAEGTIRSFVVADDGAYIVPEDDDGDGFAELQRLTADGVEALGVRPEADSLEVSPDGRYLAFLDRSGPVDQYDTPIAAAVVVDLKTGEEVLRSDDGMGDLDSDDLADLYEDAPPDIIGFADERLYYATPGDIRSVELSSGEVRTGEDHPDVGSEPATQSPDGAWTIEPAATYDDPPRLRGADGTRVTTELTAADLGINSLDPQPQDVTWTLDSWLDDTTAVGTATVSDSLDGGQTFVLITCAVPDGACQAVPGTEDGVIVPEDRRPGPLVPEPLP